MKPVIFICAVVLLSGCMTNHQNPNVSAYQPGDENASCPVLQSDLQIAKNQLAAAQHAGNMQVGQNVAAGVVGVFTLGLGWLAADTGDGHSIDAQNSQARISRLTALMAEKSCR